MNRKSTITKMANIIELYVNADDIKKVSHCSDLEAAVLADKMRNELIDKGLNGARDRDPTVRLYGTRDFK